MLKSAPLQGSWPDRRCAGVQPGRVVKPADIAKAVAFLLSKEASFITGSSMVVDGGYSNVDYFMKKENDFRD
jgi:NAD(P)-dependent dehydrogenase (short-subunit alcohol dehydrogenase family)